MHRNLLTFAAWTARLLPNWLKRAIYRFRPLAGFIRRGLNQAAPTGLTTIQVAGGDLVGCSLALNLQNEKDYWLGTYELDLQSTLRAFVQPGMIAYDVGANIGYISLLLARRVGSRGKVHAFEALPANIERLQQNIALNNLAQRVIVHKAAVTHPSGKVRFLVHASGGMGKVAGSAGRQNQYHSEIEVAGISLDDFIYTQGNPPPQALKMDIEGGEVRALQGMRRVLQQARPVLFIELHGPESARPVWEGLTAAGYQLCWMKRGYPPIASLDLLPWKAYLVARPS